MNQKTLVRLQLCYAIAGIGYNVVSSVLVQQGSAALSPTSPVAWTMAIGINAFGLILNIIGAFGLFRQNP